MWQQNVVKGEIKRLREDLEERKADLVELVKGEEFVKVPKTDRLLRDMIG